MTRRAHAVRVAMVDGERSVLNVVERSLHPIAGVVAIDAGCREELRLRRVSRIARGHVICFVAAVAVGGQRRVVIVDVAVRTLSRRRSMHAGQRECCLIVVELAVSPKGGVVAQLASRWETYCNVIDGTLGVVVVRLVAADACRVGQLVIVVDMAISALPWRNQMRAGQGKASLRVIKSCTQPR